jgi:hypothetical protein
MMLGAGWIFAALAIAPLAVAQENPPNQSMAEVLFREGRDLMRAGRFAEACPKLRDSQRLDPGIGTLLNLAHCYEQSDKTASAWAAYNEAAATARGAGQSSRQRLARDHAKALESRLVHLKIAVETKAGEEEPAVEIDGEPFPRTLWNSRFPIDPGEHVVRAHSPGKKPFTTRIMVREGTAEHSVELPLLEKQAERPSAAGTPPRAVARRRPTQPIAPSGATQPQTAGAASRRTAALILGGAGVAGLAIGVGYGWAAKSRYDESDPFCDADVCDSHGLAIREEAYERAAISSIAFAAGGGALVGAVVLWVDSASQEGQRRVALVPTLRAGVSTVAAKVIW